MLNRVFVRDFLFLLTKSKHELIEVIYDSLDFLALKEYLACRSLAVLRLFLRLSFDLALGHMNYYNHSFYIFSGKLWSDFVNNLANFRECLLPRILPWFNGVHADLLDISEDLLYPHVCCVFMLALLKGPKVGYLMDNADPIISGIWTSRWSAVFFLKIHTIWILNFNGYQRNDRIAVRKQTSWMRVTRL